MVFGLLSWKNAQAPINPKSKGNKKYSFDLDKADVIFDWLLYNKRIKIKGTHKLPPSEELYGKKFCKWHSSSTHSTNNYVVFKNILQYLVELKELQFPESK